MKKSTFLMKILAVLTAFSAVFTVACGGSGDGHTHVFDQKVQEDKYLKNDKTCTEAKQYYYSCTCGEKGEEFFSVGTKGLHDYTARVEKEEYVHTPATCLKEGRYYLSCSYCGRSSNSNTMTFSGTELGDHAYTQEKADGAYLVSEATFESPAIYYKSCVCGLVGSETFKYGEALREVTEEEKVLYQPVSITMSLYDPAESIYGFTYNTQEKPMRPVIQYEKGNTLTENAQEVSGTYSKWASNDKAENGTDLSISYYVVKAEVDLEPSTTYTYRIYDKYAQTGSETVTFQTKDTTSSSFTFSHVSDTQSVSASSAISLGKNFGNVLAQLNTDFILHTGDVVEYSKYEYEWTQMLDDNFAYLSKTPIMVTAGNHDTTYKSGVNEVWKHFNNKIPEQKTTAQGYYYSFIYGNAKFVILNTNNNPSGALDGEQLNWLTEELKSNESDWLFVGMHAPLYSIGQWGADPNKNEQSRALRAQLRALFAEYGVDMVFQGHDHLLSCTNPIDKDGKPVLPTTQTENGVEYSVDPSGVIYVMDGTVGTNTKGVIGVEEGVYKYARASAAQTWADITIDGGTLTFEAKYVTGSMVTTYYKWGITKTLA